MSDIKEQAKEQIEKLKQVDWRAKGDEAKAKVKELVSKENIDKAKNSVKDGIESLKTAEGRQNVKNAAVAGAIAAKNKVVATWNSGPKGKAICVGTVAVLLVIGSMMGDDEDFANGRLGDEDNIMLSEKGFSSIFMNVGTPEADDGKIYRHREDLSIQVLQSTSDGLLVGYVTGANPFTSGIEDFCEKFGGSFDRIIFVSTDGDNYEDGQPLRGGYYVRSGTVSYTGVDGGEHTVAHYAEITRSGEIAKIERVIEKRQKAESQAAIDAEGEAIDVDVPIKSLCGFTFGSTPSQNWNMFKENEGRLFKHKQSENFSYKDSGTLVKPFRKFTKGEIEFSFVSGMQEYLESIELRSDDIDLEKVSKESVMEEIINVKNLMEKKFNIKMARAIDATDELGRKIIKINSYMNDVERLEKESSFSWSFKDDKSEWEAERLSLFYDRGTIRLILHCGRVKEVAKALKTASKKSISLSADEGADQL